MPYYEVYGTERVYYSMVVEATDPTSSIDMAEKMPMATRLGSQWVDDNDHEFVVSDDACEVKEPVGVPVWAEEE